ncbi:hypothetical protein EI94DRAFT_1059809 [Lactarius quietus]|nr:hypothetical protein EI94DRAFT_1059809 [Lactarius quietus]
MSNNTSSAHQLSTPAQRTRSRSNTHTPSANRIFDRSALEPDHRAIQLRGGFSGKGDSAAKWIQRRADMNAMPPLALGVKLTGYRLLFMMTVFTFGTVKGILTYMGQSIAPNTLDWVSGTLLAVVLY